MLVGRLREGDAEAFDAVYAAFNKAVFTFLLRLSRHRDVAEDLHEETWLRLVRHAGRLRADTRLGPWLFTVARHLVASREVLLLVGVAGLDQSEAAQVCGISPDALRQRLHRARELLSGMLAREAAAETSAFEGVRLCPTR